MPTEAAFTVTPPVVPDDVGEPVGPVLPGVLLAHAASTSASPTTEATATKVRRDPDICSLLVCRATRCTSSLTRKIAGLRHPICPGPIGQIGRRYDDPSAGGQSRTPGGAYPRC